MAISEEDKKMIDRVTQWEKDVYEREEKQEIERIQAMIKNIKAEKSDE